MYLTFISRLKDMPFGFPLLHAVPVVLEAYDIMFELCREDSPQQTVGRQMLARNN